MSGAAVPVPRDLPRTWIPGGRSRSRDAAAGPTARPALAIELPLFAALAVLGMAQWARLVTPSSADRLALALGVVCTAAVALWGLSFLRPGPVRRLLAPAVALAGLAGALAAAGLPADLLRPAGWGELREHVHSGIGGIEQAQLPYGGTDPWVRLTLVLGAPALVAVAGAVAFWPAARRGRLRVIALALLLVTYGVGATLDNPGAEAFWGLVLLVLSVAWLWLPGLGAGQRAPAAAIAVVAGVLTLPVAARLNGPAWWDYENWSWFGAERSVRFNWDHEYGSLDWPREGTTLMTAETETPLYWKASVLDRFNGFGWQRPEAGDPAAAAELRARGAVPGSGLERKHPGWVVDATFELRALTSDVVIGAGATDSVDGVDVSFISADGTLTRAGDPIERGERYSIISYVPQPTPDQLRAAPPATSVRRFGGTTLLGLPGPDGAPVTFSMPLWGAADPRATDFLRDSPYAPTYRLAREWTAGARTPYDAVRAIEGHLRRDYAYTPTVPDHAYPLQSFLLDDRAGYCQQFAGTMGLMLRMLGIPARVVSGFAPGALDSDTGAYEVHDTDAHSWVEVYFRGIGWVTFDPTPGVAPAESQRLGGDFATAFRGPAPNPAGVEARDEGQSGPAAPAADSPGPVADEGGPWAAIGLGAMALTTALVAAGFVVARRRRERLIAGAAVEDQVAELRRALTGIGWRLSPETTLLAVERRATGAARAGIRAYAASLRAHRYAPGSAAPPGPRERRALRRAIAGGGSLGRVRAMFAVPPGGPARA